MSMKSKDVSGTILLLLLLLSIGWIGGIESNRTRSDIGRNRRDITSTFPPLLHTIRNSDEATLIHFPSDDGTVQKTTTFPPVIRKLVSIPVITDRFAEKIENELTKTSTFPPLIHKLPPRPTQSLGLGEGSDEIGQSIPSSTTNIKLSWTLKEDSKFETNSESPMKKSPEVSGIVSQRKEFSTFPPSIQKLESLGLGEGSHKISQSTSSPTTNIKLSWALKEDLKSETGPIGDEITKFESVESEKFLREAEVSEIVGQETKFSTLPPLISKKTSTFPPSSRGSRGSLMLPKNETAMLEFVKNGRCPWAILSCCMAIPRPQQPLVDCLDSLGCRVPGWNTCSTILVDTASQTISERNKNGEF